jgi:hypothetical protein
MVAFLGIVGLRWQKPIAESETINAMLTTLGGDWPYLLIIFVLGLFAVLPFRLAGWLVALAEPGE